MSNTYHIDYTALNPKRVFILQKSELEKRFDPMYYAHEYNLYNKKLSKKPFKKFHQLLKSINNGYDFRDYKESGTPYLKVANVKQGELDFTKIQYIDFNSSEISKNIQLKKGNLLITRKGTFGNAFTLDKDYDFVISSEVFYIELQDDSINPKFLEIFFNSKIGQAQFDKNKIGAIMGSLSQEAIRDLKIPLPSSETQNQIVSIYESYIVQKQKNEAEADKLLSSIDDYLLSELGIKLPEPPENTLKNRMFTTSLRELSGERFDPNAHHVERRNIIDALRKSDHRLESLKFVASFTKNIVKEIPENIPYIGLENIETNTGNYIETVEKESISSAISFKKGQILFPKLRPYLNKVYLAEFDGVCSTEFHLLDSKRVTNEYLAFFLRSQLVVNQTKYLMSGNTLPRLQTEDVENLLIPLPPLDKQKEIAEHITGIRQQAQQLKDNTKELLKKASEEIEAILLN